MSVREKARLLDTHVLVANKLLALVVVVRGKWLVQSVVETEELMNRIGKRIRLVATIAQK